jgi:hypothetical protein
MNRHEANATLCRITAPETLPTSRSVIGLEKIIRRLRRLAKNTLPPNRIMRGLVLRISLRLVCQCPPYRDGRDEPGHDSKGARHSPVWVTNLLTRYASIASLPPSEP